MTAGQERRRLILFDVCDTLYDENTTVGFIRHFQTHHRNSRVGRALDRWLNRRSIFFYVGAVLHRLIGRDIARERIIASLAGASRHDLLTAARSYVTGPLRNRMNGEIHHRLEGHKSAGDRVILLSSSIDLVVAEIAAELDADFRASMLEFKDDRCTGRLLEDLTGRKQSVIADVADGHSDLWVYTDNGSDLTLVEMADKAIIIIPRGKADDRWAGGGCEYVRL